ncbi:VUT family protein [Thorsellia anophelis]|nr:VUT family protein [Thorsellia anophelis]
MVYACLLCYSLCVLLANVFIDSFITIPNVPLIGELPLSIGTIFFGAIFTLRDHLHQSGLKYVYIGIAFSLIITLTYNYYVGIPTQFIAASFLSLMMSELTNTAVFQKFIHQTWYKKVLKSNAASVPVDSTLFAFLAFWGVFPLTQILRIIIADILFKYIVATAIIIIPKDFFKSSKQLKDENSKMKEKSNIL